MRPNRRAQGFDREQRIAHEQPPPKGRGAGEVTGNQGRLEVVEIDAGHRLSQVQLTGFAVEPKSVPIRDAVCGIGVLLDFEDDQAGPQSMHPAAGQEHRITRLNAHPVEAVRHGGGLDFAFELRARVTPFFRPT